MYAACLTPPGVAALAVLAVRGPQAWSIARSLFQPRSKSVSLPDEPRPGQFWLGRFGVEALDEVVLAVKSPGRSVGWVESSRSTAASVGLEDSAHPTEKPFCVEIHCHGGREVVRLLLETLEARGVQVCPWQEFERLTEDDPLRARAVAALAEAKTVRTAAILLDQVRGAFRRAVESVLASLRNGDVPAAAEQLAELDRRAAVGRHLTTPWRVVVAGAPNVGKSSLVNAIAGYQRCIVGPTPGTTRDVVTTLVALDGWPVELADTAGMRADAVALETAGIQLARDTAGAADLCLWVLDSSVPAKWPEPSLERVQPVVNKIDLPSAWDLPEGKNAIRVSALTGSGVPELCSAIANWLAPDPPPAGSAVPFTPELCDCVGQTKEMIRAERITEATAEMEAVSCKSR
jgi:tRNA modification GTPase